MADWIDKVIDDGKMIFVEDGSLWEVSPIDVVPSMIWLPVSDVTVIESDGIFPYKIINTDDGESVEAKYITLEKVKMITNNNKGTFGRKLIAEFFDSNYSKFFSFPNPKAKSNAQVADVLIWMNRVVFLIEVKTRSEGRYTSIDSWARSKIQEAVRQITTNYKRIKDGETVNLHNSYYHTTLDCVGISKIIGLVILVHDDQINYLPSHAVSDIYKNGMPIHVISWNNLRQMTTEIDTVPDFVYYLNDRSNYLELADIPLSAELNVLGYYNMYLITF